MRHQKQGKNLGRTASHRNALVANLTSSLIINEYISTTITKAKACKRYFDRVMSVAKKGDLYARRRVEMLLRDKLAADKVMEVLVNRFKDRSGGFTTLVRIGIRPGDNAQMGKLVLIGSKPVKSAKKVKARSKKAAKKTTKEPKKKQEAKGKEKQSVLDKVKELRGKFLGKKGDPIQKKDQTSGVGKQMPTRSRSGI